MMHLKKPRKYGGRGMLWGLCPHVQVMIAYKPTSLPLWREAPRSHSVFPGSWKHGRDSGEGRWPSLPVDPQLKIHGILVSQPGSSFPSNALCILQWVCFPPLPRGLRPCATSMVLNGNADVLRHPRAWLWNSINKIQSMNQWRPLWNGVWKNSRKNTSL